MSLGIKLTPADKWFSLCVRERVGWRCERCMKSYSPPTSALQCAHYFGRRNWATRFEPLNAFCLCFACHQYFHENPYSFVAWAEMKLGEAVVGILREKADDLKIGKEVRSTKGVGDIAEHYKSQYEHMLEKRRIGRTEKLPFYGWL